MPFRFMTSYVISYAVSTSLNRTFFWLWMSKKLHCKKICVSLRLDNKQNNTRCKWQCDNRHRTWTLSCPSLTCNRSSAQLPAQYLLQQPLSQNYIIRCNATFKTEQRSRIVPTCQRSFHHSSEQAYYEKTLTLRVSLYECFSVGPTARKKKKKTCTPTTQISKLNNII